MHMQTDRELNPIINVTLTLLSSAHGQAHNRSRRQWGGAWVLLAECNETHLLLIALWHHCKNPSISAPVLAQWWKVPWADKTLNLLLTNYIGLKAVWKSCRFCARRTCPWGPKQHNITGKPLNQWPPNPATLDQQQNHSICILEVIMPDFCLSLYSHPQETFCLYIFILFFCQIKGMKLPISLCPSSIPTTK